MVDLGSAVIPTFSLSTLSAGFIARVAISMTPFLLPLMFQMGMGTTAFQAGLMLLVYMAGNLAMKSATTPILRRFAFRRVIVVNGCLCAITLFGCGLLSGSVPLAATWVVLFAAGMSRSMNFTSTNTLAFADVPEALRASATTLAAIAQQVAAAFAIAMAILCLNLSQLWREGSRLALVDFRNALFAAGALMVISTLWSTRLDRQAGVALTSAKSRC